MLPRTVRPPPTLYGGGAEEENRCQSGRSVRPGDTVREADRRALTGTRRVGRRFRGRRSRISSTASSSAAAAARRDSTTAASATTASTCKKHMGQKRSKQHQHTAAMRYSRTEAAPPRRGTSRAPPRCLLLSLCPLAAASSDHVVDRRLCDLGLDRKGMYIAGVRMDCCDCLCVERVDVGPLLLEAMCDGVKARRSCPTRLSPRVLRITCRIKMPKQDTALREAETDTQGNGH